MKKAELIRKHLDTLLLLQSEDINVSDIKNIELFTEYERLKGEGLKITYIVAYLQDVYGISERNVYYIISRLEKSCKNFA